MKVLKDKQLIDKFLNRGVEAVYPSKESLHEKLMSGERMKVYQGFDPTGPHLHVGHAMGIRALSILQKLGHEVIFLIGDFTAKIGDPDKEKTRKILTDAEIEKNMAGWKNQAKQLIDFGGKNPVKFKRNNKWLSKLDLEKILDLMSKVTVQQMIERDLFDKRLKENNPVGLHEFMYPLMQAYDGVAMEVDMEIGGTDQTFNMLMGRQFSKICLNKEKFVRTNKMMEAPEGLTMSKTKGNGINLSDSPEEMYGKAMSYPDELIVKGLKLLTNVPLEKIEEIEKAIKSSENPMQLKKLMAFEIVGTIKGEKDAEKAQDFFEKTVQKEKIPEDIQKIGAEERVPLYKIASKIDPNLSNSQVRRIIKQGGLTINGEKIKDPTAEIELKSGDIIKLGKRRYAEIK